MRAERAGVQQVRPFARDAAQRLGIVAGDQPRAGRDRRAAGQIELRDLRIQRHVGGAVGDAFMQVGRYAEAARGMADRRLHHVGQRERAEARQRLAPALQVAGRWRPRSGPTAFFRPIVSIVPGAAFGSGV